MAIYKHENIPTKTIVIFIMRCRFVFWLYKKTQGKIKARCKGLEIKLGTNPENIRKMWNAMDIKPKTIHIL